MKFTTLFFSFLAVASATTLGRPKTRPNAYPPSEDKWYDPPSKDKLEKRKNGEIIKARDVPNAIAALGVAPLKLKKAKQIMFKSTGAHGDPTGAVTTVLVPYSANYLKMVSYQFAENAAFEDCAPSYAMQLGTGGVISDILSKAEVLLINAALSKGWVVTIPDYEGYESAFGSRNMSGHVVLDGIRATLDSHDHTGAFPGADVALWGYSGGGTATAAAVEMHKDYAPEVNIVGAAMGGVMPKLDDVISLTNATENAGMGVAVLRGMANVNKDFRDKMIRWKVKTKWAKLFGESKRQCFVSNHVMYANNYISEYFDDWDEWMQKEWIKTIFRVNSLGITAPKVPVLVYHSKNDDVSPIENTAELVDHYCAGGTPSVIFHTNTKADHMELGVLGAPRVLKYLANLMDGESMPNGCKEEVSERMSLDPQKEDDTGELFVANLISDFGSTKTGPMAKIY